MSRREIFTPDDAVIFQDANRGEMMLTSQFQQGVPWICYRHPDGQWVSLRRATEDDLQRLRPLTQRVITLTQIAMLSSEPAQ